MSDESTKRAILHSTITEHAKLQDNLDLIFSTIQQAEMDWLCDHDEMFKKLQNDSKNEEAINIVLEKMKQDTEKLGACLDMLDLMHGVPSEQVDRFHKVVKLIVTYDESIKLIYALKLVSIHGKLFDDEGHIVTEGK